jgi:hypothetical protein
MIGRTAILSVPVACGAQAESIITRLIKARIILGFIETEFLSYGWIEGYYAGIA